MLRSHLQYLHNNQRNYNHRRERDACGYDTLHCCPSQEIVLRMCAGLVLSPELQFAASHSWLKTNGRSRRRQHFKGTTLAQNVENQGSSSALSMIYYHYCTRDDDDSLRRNRPGRVLPHRKKCVRVRFSNNLAYDRLKLVTCTKACVESIWSGSSATMVATRMGGPFESPDHREESRTWGKHLLSSIALP